MELREDGVWLSPLEVSNIISEETQSRTDIEDELWPQVESYVLEHKGKVIEILGGLHTEWIEEGIISESYYREQTQNAAEVSTGRVLDKDLTRWVLDNCVITGDYTDHVFHLSIFRTHSLIEHFLEEAQRMAQVAEYSTSSTLRSVCIGIQEKYLRKASLLIRIIPPNLRSQIIKDRPDS